MRAPAHARATSLFLFCVDLDPEDRRAFLARACADDPTVLAEVEALLEHADDEPEALRTGQFFPRFAPVALPERIGPYRILGLLGQGGMGVVYRAEQLAPVRREVALKLVRAGLDSPELLARFESEYVALASLGHPNIARLYDVGVADDGRPYFAMEYVDGQPITDCCDQRGLGLAARIELFSALCAAVQHAHQNAVIHRDIKPSNLLVTVRDGKLVPMVIDFGIARVFGVDATARRRATIVGEILGTPEYMSPEQAAGSAGIDTRTDVYSLGAVLYELLAGSPPFWDPTGQLGVDDLRRRIREDEAQAPSARLRDLSMEERSEIAEKRGTDTTGLVRQMRGDLDWIVLKALSGERARRYASPADLAGDLERHLVHEPVLAGPGGLAYRTAKFVRKHRAAVAVTAAVVVLSTGLGGLSVRNASRVAQEAERADREAAVATQVADILSRLFERPMIAPRSDQRSAAEKLGPGIERVRRELADRPAVQARLLRALGEAYATLGDPAAGRPLLEEAQTTLARELGPDDPATLEAADALGNIRFTMGDAGAERLYEETLEARKRVLGPEHVDTLRSAGHLGYLYKSTGRLDEAAPLLESAASGLRRALGPDSAEALIAAGFLAGVRVDQRRPAGLEPVLLELVEKMPRILGERNIESLAAWYNLGCYYAMVGEPELALNSLREAIDRGFVRAAPIDADPGFELLREDPRLRELLVLERYNIVMLWQVQLDAASTHAAQGRVDEAEQIFRAVLAAAERTALPMHVDAYNARLGLARLYMQLRRYSDLEEIVRSWPRPDDNNPEWFLYLCELHRGDEAKALLTIERLLENVPESTAVFAYLTAVRHAVMGDADTSRRWLSLAVDRKFGPDWWAKYDLAFDPYRNDPRFRPLLARLERQGGLADRQH